MNPDGETTAIDQRCVECRNACLSSTTWITDQYGSLHGPYCQACARRRAGINVSITPVPITAPEISAPVKPGPHILKLVKDLGAHPKCGWDDCQKCTEHASCESAARLLALLDSIAYMKD